MAPEVVFAPEALADLLELYDYIAAAGSPASALTYVEQVRAYCLGFVTFPERGTQRDDLRPGLRTAGYRRRVTVALHVTTESVVIDRILYGGRDLDGLFAACSRRTPMGDGPVLPVPTARRASGTSGAGRIRRYGNRGGVVWMTALRWSD